MEIKKASKIGALLVSHWANDGYSVFLPPLLFSVISVKFGLSTMQAATIVSVYTASTAIAQMPVAFITDYTGRAKEVLAAGLLLFSLAMAGYGWSPSYETMLLFAFISGLGFSGYHPVSMNLMTEEFKGRKGLSMGIFTVTGSLGASMVPMIAGLFGNNWEMAAWVLAVPGVVSAVWIYLAFEKTKLIEKKDRSAVLIIKSVFTNPLLILTATLGGINQITYWGSVTFIPLFLAYSYGWNEVATGAVLGAFHFSALVSQPLFGYLSDIFDRNRLLLLLMVTSGGASILFSLVEAPAFSVIFSVIIGAVVLALRTLVVTKITDVVEPKVKSTAIGLNFTFGTGLGSLAPLLGGFLEQLFSFKVVFLTFGLITWSGLAVLYLLIKLENKATTNLSV